MLTVYIRLATARFADEMWATPRWLDERRLELSRFVVTKRAASYWCGWKFESNPEAEVFFLRAPQGRAAWPLKA